LAIQNKILFIDEIVLTWLYSGVNGYPFSIFLKVRLYPSAAS